MTASIVQMLSYPIKGLSGKTLDTVTLEKGRGFPFDRTFSFARNGSGVNPENPRPMPKSRFHVLARDEALARLHTEFDVSTRTLTVQDRETGFVFDCSTPSGQQQANQFIAGVVGLDADQSPTFIDGGDIHFTDVCVTSPQFMHAVSIINLASVRALGEKIGSLVDPHRFRGNLLVDGWPAFAELEAMEQEIELGSAKVRIIRRTKRCPATQVNLQTAQRDLDIPSLLDDHFGHSDMGVYAEVIEGGVIRAGDTVSDLQP